MQKKNVALLAQLRLSLLFCKLLMYNIDYNIIKNILIGINVEYVI